MSASGTSPKWGNWTGNIVHEPPTNGANYYFTPTNLVELQSVVADAVKQGVTLRVSGQRHSQPALVTNDNRGAVAPKPTTYLVDMSCYADLGAAGKDLMVLGPGPNQITVNPGVREDDLDAFLTRNNLMLDAVTAGGFFSIGGMTAVDVHGGTIQGPIFAEAVASFTIVGPDGKETVIDKNTKDGSGNAVLTFARVSLGTLGIVTRITIDVLPRPWANTMQGGSVRYLLAKKADFIAKYKELLTGPAKHSRMESFFTPYAAPFSISNFLVLWWDIINNPTPQIPNSAPAPESACKLAHEGKYGAALIGIGEFGEAVVRASQTTDPYWSPLAGPAVITAVALDEIEKQVKAANQVYSDLWLAKSSQVIFMSYFVEMPGYDDAGLARAWESLEVVNNYVVQSGNFHIAAPMEFRFVKGGDSAMSGAFTKNPNSYFVNLDLIGFVEQTPSSQYPDELLKFFAHVERKWVAMGGLPHNGKMYGFYDPTNPAQDSYTPPFNTNFLSFITKQRTQTRQAPVDAFKKYRQSRDPGGLFYSQYLKDLLG
ncbi:MAG TPA: FAD-binding protein [Bryobacteraceae bacterium]|nr:FAD-binding protein [Bryobacteraceae bacterium]